MQVYTSQPGPGNRIKKKYIYIRAFFVYVYKLKLYDNCKMRIRTVYVYYNIVSIGFELFWTSLSFHGITRMYDVILYHCV